MDELQNGAVVRTYSYGRDRISETQFTGNSTTPSFYGYDGHGNVRSLTNMSGAVTDTYQYDAFGNLIASTGSTVNNFLYDGEQSDNALGLYYLRSRYLDVQTDRFSTMDPEPGRIEDPSTFHRYLFTRDNPVNLVDPSGRQELLEFAVEVKNSYDLYSKYPRAYAVCTFGLLYGVSNAFQDAVDGIGISPDGAKIAYDFEKCIFDAVLPHPRQLIKEQIKKEVKDIVALDCKPTFSISGLGDYAACKIAEKALDDALDKATDYILDKAHIPDSIFP